MTILATVVARVRLEPVAGVAAREIAAATVQLDQLPMVVHPRVPVRSAPERDGPYGSDRESSARYTPGQGARGLRGTTTPTIQRVTTLERGGAEWRSNS